MATIPIPWARVEAVEHGSATIATSIERSAPFLHSTRVPHAQHTALAAASQTSTLAAMGRAPVYRPTRILMSKARASSLSSNVLIQTARRRRITNLCMTACVLSRAWNSSTPSSGTTAGSRGRPLSSEARCKHWRRLAPPGAACRCQGAMRRCLSLAAMGEWRSGSWRRLRQRRRPATSGSFCSRLRRACAKRSLAAGSCDAGSHAYASHMLTRPRQRTSPAHHRRLHRHLRRRRPPDGHATRATTSYSSVCGR